MEDTTDRAAAIAAAWAFVRAWYAEQPRGAAVVALGDELDEAADADLVPVGGHRPGGQL